MKKHKFYLTANITTEDETDAIKTEVASVINLPEGIDKQPDLGYFSAILVSTGTNLNNACFLGSELVAAAGTIAGKALDIEHEEQEIIGHLYSYAFTDKEHKALNMSELASTETGTLDTKDMHIQVGAIVYKNRFPDIAKEIANKEYKVSMECCYKNFDIKVGNVIVPKAAANALGIDILDESVYGKSAKVIKDGIEIAEGNVARVLRGICFSGCGVVANPANPPSVIIETASTEEEKPIVFNLDLVESASENNKNNQEQIEKNEEIINVTSQSIEAKSEDAELCYDDTIGICVSYKRRLLDKNEVVIADDWCSLYSQGCTSGSRDATDQDCLRVKSAKMTAAVVEAIIKNKYSDGVMTKQLERLEKALSEAKKNFKD